MEYYSKIEEKLKQFTFKFYKNELIKGVMLFLSFGSLYLFVTLFIEHFFWLPSSLRTLLFWLFVVVETFLLYQFVISAVFKLIGLQKGISFKESSVIIGKHFPEVADKLLNILELKEEQSSSELIMASIEQKSSQLRRIPFSNAIDFKQNKKYLSLLLIPLGILGLSWTMGIQGSLQDSLTRVVDYKTAYSPPAPYSFMVLNEKLETIEGQDFTVKIGVQGDVQPDLVKLNIGQQSYFLQKNQEGLFNYTITNPIDNLSFYVTTEEVVSESYELNVLKSPNINNIALHLDYPSYLRKENTSISSATNISVPEGTTVTWQVSTKNTKQVDFLTNRTKNKLEIDEDGYFILTKRVRKPFLYQITSSNDQLKEFEKLSYAIDVIKDEYPKITVESDIDSITRGPVSFLGQISDDYGISKLELIYYDTNNPQQVSIKKIPIRKENLQFFSYQFPGDIKVKEGLTYELFFRVSDNDQVNGVKRVKSKLFTYASKTKEEVAQEILLEQKEAINNLEKTIRNQQEQDKELNSIQQDLQNKKNLEWNDKKKIENLIKRQEQYQEMMQRQTDKLMQNFEETKDEEELLGDKKEQLKQRMEELKKLAKQNELMDEIKKMADKLDKEDLIEKTKELAEQNRQRERSLERILEMTKRFYVEQKTMQIANKVDELSKKQENLATEPQMDSLRQQEINDEFEGVKKELKDLQKDNESLKEPMDLPDVEDEKEAIEESLEESMDQVKKADQKSAKKAQHKAAQQMKKMSQKMEKSMMEAQGESMEENADDLRKILENLVLFSFEQEQLFDDFDEISSAHPNFGKYLKKQNVLKTHFEHIDDSLYVLSMRLPQLSTRMQNDLASAHYNLDQSLENFSQNRMYQGQSNQRYVMTATNNLADYLSSMLDNMKNSMSMKKGKGKKKSNEFSLPDLIEKQKGLSDQMKEGLEQSKKEQDGKKQEEKGKQGKGKDEMEGDIYEIYKQQNQLRQLLEDALPDKNGAGDKPGNSTREVLKTMEQLENELLEKGFNSETLRKMELLQYELLKLDEASLQQNKGKKRKSNTNKDVFPGNKFQYLKNKKDYFKQLELLNKQSLPLQPKYRKKVRSYFSDN